MHGATIKIYMYCWLFGVTSFCTWCKAWVVNSLLYTLIYGWQKRISL